jgi:1-acyl-sn-glycerol-3-phosphate acyltransferase
MTSLVTLVRLVIIALVGLLMGFIAFVTIPVDRTGRIYFWTGYAWSKIALRSSRVRVTVAGLEHIHPDQSYIFVTNHASMADIPAMLATFSRVRIMFKKELSYVPIWGWALRWGRHIMVDRARAGEAMRSIERAAQAIREGDSVILFAEGTRSPDGKLQPFKRGAFTLAAKSGVPVVPVTINGSSHVMPKHSFAIQPSTIELIVNPPIPTADIATREQEIGLMNTVRNIIASQYREQ